MKKISKKKKKKRKKSRIPKWDLIKFQSFYKKKNTTKKTKRPLTDWESIFTNPKSGIGSHIQYIQGTQAVELQRNQITPVKKCGTYLNNEFSTEEYQITENHLKKVQHP